MRAAIVGRRRARPGGGVLRSVPVAIDPDEYDFEDYDPLDERSVDPIRRSRAVRWTAILIVASFALAGLSSLSNWW